VADISLEELNSGDVPATKGREILKESASVKITGWGKLSFLNLVYEEIRWV